MFRAFFSRRARKAFLDLSDEQARRVRDAIQELAEDPCRPGTIKLEHAPVAQCRQRIGNLRIMFDIDERNNAIEILDIRKRDEQTYK